MKKTFYYSLIPTKAEEDAPKSHPTILHQATRVLVEIHDVHPPPCIDYQNPWKIERTLSDYEVATAKIIVSFNDTFEHVFRYWNMGMANLVVQGHRASVDLWDVTEQTNPIRYGNDVYFEMLPDDDFVLGCMDVFKDRYLNVGDEIAIFWDPRASNFQFRLLRKVI